MQIKVKPVFVLGKGRAMFCRPDGCLERITDSEVIKSRVESLAQQLRERLKSDLDFMEPALVKEEADFIELRKDVPEADALLIYLLGPMPIGRLLDLKIPLIAFSGEYTPMMALYAFPIERDYHTNLSIALDFKEIADQIRLLQVRKRLKGTRVALIGFPPDWYSRWHHLPDPELVRHKLGVEIAPVEAREFLAEVSMIQEARAEAVAREWMGNAQEVVEPSLAEVKEAAKMFIALDQILKQRRAQAVALNCLEPIFSLRPCLPLSWLRDNGVPAACEADVSALLTMLILGYIADKPAFMGNIVRADPENNLVMISHCIVPSKMAGLAQPAKPYRLRNYHGRYGVTAYVNLDRGQEVTIARVARGLEKILALRGKIVDCRDTVSCRTTITVEISDAREFIRKALGNHHVMVYGDHIGEIRALSQAVGMNLIEL